MPNVHQTELHLFWIINVESRQLRTFAVWGNTKNSCASCVNHQEATWKKVYLCQKHLQQIKLFKASQKNHNRHKNVTKLSYLDKKIQHVKLCIQLLLRYHDSQIDRHITKYSRCWNHNKFLEINIFPWLLGARRCYVLKNWQQALLHSNWKLHVTVIYGIWKIPLAL